MFLDRHNARLMEKEGGTNLDAELFASYKPWDSNKHHILPKTRDQWQETRDTLL